MKKILTFLTLLVLMLQGLGQTVETVISPTKDQWGGTYQALLHKPNDYDTTTKKYPLLVFLHGKGESTGDLSAIYNNAGAGGPAYFIEHGQWPASFTNPADGLPYKFIVLSPQALGTDWSASAYSLDYMIRFMVSNYRVDTNRIYITGLSAGGAGIVEYAGHGTVNGAPYNARYKVAAFVPMSQAYGEPTQAMCNSIVADSVHTWGFGSPASDIHGENTLRLINKINLVKPGYGLWTNYSGGHCCWNNFYTPAYHETIGSTSMNIYEWMLSFYRPVITTPAANAGTNQVINLPVSSIVLTGSGTPGVGHTIASYAWTRINGPDTATIISPTSASTTVSNLSAGVHTFRLTVTNDAGITATSTVTVTVYPALDPAVTRYVKVRMFGGVNPYTTGGWNNWNIASNLGSGNLLYSTGQASTVVVTTNYTTAIAENPTTYPVTMCPIEVGRYASYNSSSDAVFTISGLDNSKRYNLETYNTRNRTDGQITNVIVGGVTRTIQTDNNYATSAAFTNLIPVNGAIVITLHRLSTYHYINGLQLTEISTDSTARIITDAQPVKPAVKPADRFSTDNTVAGKWIAGPTPFTQFVTVKTKLEKAQPAIITRVIDLSGHVLFSKTFNNVAAGNWQQTLKMPATVSSQGVYLLQISGPALAKPITIKLLKDK